MKYPFAVAMAAALVHAAEAHATVTIRLEVNPPQPVAGEPFHVVYSLQVVNDLAVEAAPLNMGRLHVLANPGPPSMPRYFMFAGGPGVAMTMATSVEYIAVAPTAGRYTITGAQAMDTQSGRVVARHPPIVLVVSPPHPGAPTFVPGNSQLPQAQGARMVPLFPPNGLPDPFGQEPEPSAVMSSADPDAPPSGRLTGAVFNPEGFIRYAVDNPSPYIGQEVILRAWLYLPSGNAGCEPTVEPGLDGFWSEPLILNQNVCAARWNSQTVGTRTMAAGLVRKIALYPTHAGTLRIGPMGMNAEYIQGDAFFGNRRQLEVHSGELTVTVQEPPTPGRPAGYIPGTVGQVGLSATIDRPYVPVGETVTVAIRASGNGYLGSAGLPALAPVDGLRIHPGASEVGHQVDGDIVRDTLDNRYLVVATRPGTFSMGTLDVPWLDPTTGHYAFSRVTLPTLTATGEALARDDDAVHPDPATELSPYDPDPSLRPHRAVFVTGFRAWGALSIPPLSVLLGLAGVSLRRTLRARRAAEKDRARTDPTALLTQSESALAAGRHADAVSFAGRALEHARRDNPGNVSDDVRDLVADAQTRCDTARFGGRTVDATDIVASVRAAVDALERLS